MTLAGNQLPPPRRLRPWSGLERRLRDVGISGRTLVIAAPAIWLTVFFLVPLFVVFGISLATKQFGRPPYSPLLTTEGGDSPGTYAVGVERFRSSFGLPSTLFEITKVE